jgi:hypothetical protein
LPLLEAGLVEPGLEKVRGQLLGLGQDRLFHDLGDVRAHDDGANVLELGFVLALILGEGYKASLSKVLWYL